MVFEVYKTVLMFTLFTYLWVTYVMSSDVCWVPYEKIKHHVHKTQSIKMYIN